VYTAAEDKSVDDAGLHFFLPFKIDFVKGMEYRQQIKTFQLKYIFPGGKIIRTAKGGDEINLT